MEPDEAEGRPTLRDGSPVVTLEQRLTYEVERMESRLEAARDDLRRWRLSNGTD